MDLITRQLMMGAAGGASVPSLVSTPNMLGNPSAVSINISAPTHSEGDTLFAFLLTNSSGDWTLPSGWTSIATGGGSDIVWKVAGSGEPGSYTFAFDSPFGARRLGVAIGALSAGATPDGTSIALSNVMSSISPTKPGLLLLLAGSIGSSHTFTTPTGMTQVASELDGDFPDFVLYSEEVQDGATGTRTNHADVERSMGVVFTF